MKQSRVSALLLGMTAVGFLLSPTLYSQTRDDAILDQDPINVYKGDPINIEGYKKKPLATDRELETIKGELQRQQHTIVLDKEKANNLKELSRTTEKLSDVRDEMIEEKIDSQKAIAQHNKKFKQSEERLKCLEANNWDRSKCPRNGAYGSDSVSVKQSAQQVGKLEAVVPKVEKKDPIFRVTPFAGMAIYQGEYFDTMDSFESKITTGLKLESKVSNRIAVGVGFTYTSMSIYQTPSLYSGYMGMGSMGGNEYLGREISFKNFSGDIYSKLYLLVDSRFSPYFGLGIGYSRTRLDFDSSQVSYQSYGAQNDGYTANDAVGEAMGGVDIEFTKNVGLNLELKYMKGLTSLFAAEEEEYPTYSYGVSRDQYFIEELGKDLSAAHTFSVTAGLNVSF